MRLAPDRTGNKDATDRRATEGTKQTEFAAAATRPMKKKLCTMSVALAIIAYSSGASSANSALIAFLDQARAAVERCNTLALEPAKAIERDSNAVRRCVNEAQRKIEPFYDAAAEAVRMQHGTSMYLSMYHTQWTQHMQRLSDPEPGQAGSMREMIAHDMEQLRMLENKLIQ